jgi:thioredoxin reductase (NADPH)
MKKPIILTVDDDAQVLAAITRDLRQEFRQHYRILSVNSGPEALSTLTELRARAEPLALVLADQRMPEVEGVEVLTRARELFPEAKRVLLTAYADTTAAIKAINSAQLDYYLLKPWDPPEQLAGELPACFCRPAADWLPVVTALARAQGLLEWLHGGLSMA